MSDKDRITIENGIVNASKKSVEFYLSKGLDRAYAEYYASGKKKITNVEACEDFTLILSFDNGELRRYDCKPLLKPGTVFEPFISYENFKRVYLDDAHVVSWDIDPNVDSEKVWNNKVDICPDGCYIDSVPVERSVADA